MGPGALLVIPRLEAKAFWKPSKGPGQEERLRRRLGVTPYKPAGLQQTDKLCNHSAPSPLATKHDVMSWRGVFQALHIVTIRNSLLFQCWKLGYSLVVICPVSQLTKPFSIYELVQSSRQSF